MESEERNTALERQLKSELSRLRIVAPVVFYYPTIDSTMNVAWQMVEDKKNPPPDGTVIIAEHQTSGRGRDGREWYSPNGGVWLSIITYSDDAQNMPLQSHLAGIAACTTIQEYLPSASIRWINDVLYEDKKLCGILCEEKGNYTIIGVGVDTNIEAFPEELGAIATSIKLETQKDVDNLEFIKAFLANFDCLYTLYKNRRYSEILGRYRRMCSSLGRRIQVTRGTETFLAESIDLDQSGALVVKTESGLTKTLIDGGIEYV